MVDTSESQHAVKVLLSQWATCGRLSYKFHVTAAARGRDGLPRMVATFSKPTAETPSPEAVARLYFHLSEDHRHVRGFTVEQDPHFHDLEITKFDEAVLDRVIRRKLQLQATRLVDLGDEFASTRVPSVMHAKEEEEREHRREAMEEYLLEQMQHSDSYNDGKLAIEVFRETVDALELDPSVAPREVLLALVVADRDDLATYDDIVSIAADMIDAMSGTGPTDRKTTDEEDEAIDAFEVVSARQTNYTVEKLTMLLEAHAERVAEAASAMAARRAAAEMEAQQEATPAIPEETKEVENEEEEEEEEAAQETVPTGDEAPHDADTDDTSVRANPLQNSIQCPRMTRYQLRALLETPQLLLSEAEINLMLALAETKTNPNGIEEVLCENLAPLLRRVRRIIFHYQRKSFVDRTERYLLHQFQAFEGHNLQGASKHLKQRLTQKEVKAAVKSMQKLLLSPYQLMQIAALSEERPDVPDHVVYYQEFIPRMIQHLHELVDVETLAEKSALLHEMGVWDFAAVDLPGEGAVRQESFDCFASFDTTQHGAIQIGDFYEALKRLAQDHDYSVGTTPEMKQLGVLADPNGSGRVNYAYFQHLMYPLMLFLHQERELAAARDGARKQFGEQERKSG